MAREKAARLLVNYFQAIAKHAGMKWDPDYTVEIEQAVDEIVEAAVSEAQADAESRYGVGDWRNAR
jgi:hypothetical protein